MASKKEKHTQFNLFSIKIQVKSIGLDILINASDPLDLLTVGAGVISHLKRLGKEPTVLILP